MENCHFCFYLPVLILQDQARHVRSVDSSAELHIFELKSPLPPAADDVTAVPLIPGAQLVSGSPLWELPPKKEVSVYREKKSSLKLPY